ncbi:hypothetical protein DFR79_10922 [Halanaerobium saccharolyticum]|uniref:Uncharacterized protein n=1 Tax=Halanaerobium saccharolyticum TaxID=43595 RepID=A0A4R6LRQ4_9FIRM|nr:hypothetical protein [Halanaerobium saccharolyticum]TDO91274.1 hypothetical protein DFR79_10922 [Halanaerobium saccharolyticum]
MRVKLIFIIIVSVLVLSVNPVQAQSDLDSRLALIEASQQLEAENAKELGPRKHKFGVTLSNFSSEGNLLNPGFRLENQLTGTRGRGLKLISEAYYLREEDDFAGFISLAFEPHPLGYFGAGAEVTGRANYQVFAGVNITENIFAEVKGINPEENGSEETEIYFGTGFMIGF